MFRSTRRTLLRPLVALSVVLAAIATQPTEAHAVDFCGFYCAGLVL